MNSKWVFPIAWAFIILFVVAGEVWAQSGPIARCAPRAEMMATLEQRFQEVPTVAATRRGMMLEFTVSPKGTWTMLAISETGIACVLADGLDWTAGPPGKDA